MQWISVKDRPPPNGKNVILLCNPIEDVKEDLIFIGNCWDNDRVYSIWGDGYVPFIYTDITHWMELPEIPQ